MKSATNSSRRQTRCRTLAEIDFINSSAFRQTQVSLRHRQEQLNRNQFERLLTHDKEHAELKQFLKQIRQVDSAKCRPVDYRGNDEITKSEKVGIPEHATKRDDTVRNAKERSCSDSDLTLPDQMAGLNLQTGGGGRKLPFGREKNNPDEGEAEKIGYIGVKDKSTSTIKPAKVTLSKEENIMKQIAALASNNTVSHTSPQNDVTVLSASEANASSATVITKPVRAGFSTFRVDSSSASDEESVFEDTETKRHRQRRKVIRRQSKSLDAQSPPRTTSTNGICRNCCVKQYQFSDEKNLNVFIASQKSILKRRKSSSDVFRTKQLTPGQLVDLQTNRDRPSIFYKN